MLSESVISLLTFDLYDGASLFGFVVHARLARTCVSGNIHSHVTLIVFWLCFADLSLSHQDLCMVREPHHSLAYVVEHEYELRCIEGVKVLIKNLLFGLR